MAKTARNGGMNALSFSPPPADCPLCPRLNQFREDNKREYPSFFNGAVPSFGAFNARLLVVGLAPGLKGANQTGRPFTGDFAGLVLYGALLRNGLASGEFAPENFMTEAGAGGDPAQPHGKDTLQLVDCRVTNAVRCVPPENKPEPSEIKQCNGFLAKEMAAMPNLQAVLTLGLVSHNAVIKALGFKASSAKFGHAAVHKLHPRITIVNTYHSSRYNINTGRLTQAMFDDVVALAKAQLT